MSPNDVAVSGIRTRVMAALASLEKGETLEVSRLVAVFGSDEKEAIVQLRALEAIGYVKFGADHSDNQKLGYVVATPKGLQAYLAQAERVKEASRKRREKLQNARAMRAATDSTSAELELT